MGQNKKLDRILGIDYCISGVCLILLVCVTFFGVIWRYFLNSPFIWQEEVQLGLITWVIYFGASAAFRNGSHIAIDMIVDMFPEKMQKVMDVIIYIVSMGVLGFIFINGISLVQQFIRTSRVTNILRIPTQYIYMAIPIGCVLMAVSYTIYLIRDFKGLNIEEEEEDK
ncbi:TRAP transporter small permease [Kineothrix sp. MB12-C1]|uniref:TRAP transporter small permease n=1 Tax=Kineothrix sp. MB12-C1 TaxID=3070215 RepID=UPI0027D2C85D|nr:TRAP transporter small permease [Kineothrix sp. MB12-C1]WMC92125.1 TRAP transporter small permease [Kineothrix sp. MB12-C1]